MKPYSILIVEDHPFQRQYLHHLFSELGHFNLHTAKDGHEAMARLHEGEFNLVLTDLLMPTMDGVLFIQQLATLPCRPDLAIMTSASRRMLTAASLVAKNLGIRVVGLISKPMTPPALHALVAQLRPARHSTSDRSELPAFDRRSFIQALDSQALQAWFQPRVSVQKGNIVAAEALVRWVHLERGVLLPGAFLPALEANGLEERLLWEMLEQAMAAQACWRLKGFDIPVSINLPTHLLDDPNLADRLLKFVLHHQGAPGNLCFELLESSHTLKPANYYAGACRLRMKGFALAQDDFGKGYSSYLNLVSTPFSELKIDRALVQGSQDNDHMASALSSLIALGRKLGLTVVAEGVETAEQLQLLRKTGCEQAQGFLISQALPASQFEQMLAAEANP
ncbi:EAL domain-containing protein [Pseudomonas mosselii]|uniref:EAL domain-containing response regulator n=1 Tax=unclassified Pseudomonas TaxID=196821 RepID=UPI0020C33877|nr:EAL domain-containing protein [Pseudomonas sp. DVZ24]MCP8633659.1 EAL domain-containing protein [Pseudomonas sp. DVZ6]MDC0687602.1 EAL domain-containing protein [Mitsuaria sp. RG]MDD7785045.1 EAL domain-containing protein [Pseudomonas sp. DVZ24]